MKLFLLLVASAAAGFRAMGAAEAGDGPFCGRTGKFAPIRHVSGTVVSTGTTWWGTHYIVMQDQDTGCRVYVPTEEAACVPGRSFGGAGRMTSAKEKNYEVTFRLVFTGDSQPCG